MRSRNIVTAALKHPEVGRLAAFASLLLCAYAPRPAGYNVQVPGARQAPAPQVQAEDGARHPARTEHAAAGAPRNTQANGTTGERHLLT